ncbi:RidA family protein [Desulfitobacterium sp. AusDCA]|uniref:RidA family protein n=1 Tax=Desulfitobacterium sp. AusDCA TaxID=3240383 RepID=UPI003DA77712
MTKQIINTEDAPKAIGPYSQAIKISNFIFVSGQLPIDPSTGKIPGDIKAQVHQSLKNISSILNQAGSSLSQVIKTTIFLKDLNDFSLVNKIYGDYFKADYPARSTIQISKLPLDAKVEIEVISTL